MMPTYAISIEFITNKPKTDEKAQALADRIKEYVIQEKMAHDANVIDIELLEPDDDAVEELDFEDDE